MAAFIVSIFAVFGFAAAFIYLKVVPVAKAGTDVALSGISIMFDKAASDDDKQAAVQAAGLNLLKVGFHIFWRLGACLILAALPLFIAEEMGVASIDAVITLMLRWDYIIGTIVVFGGAAWYYNKNKRKESDSAYSGADQMIHKIAFSSPGVQLTVAELEDRFFTGDIEEVNDKPPIFITSLPRAGTTILLTALNDLPETATHTYRDMPFVMAPLLWSRMSKRFGKKAAAVERAHGDGLKISYDSPEAFEEIIWRSFWPEKYHEHSIDMWRAGDHKPEAIAFFTKHFKKMVALRAQGEGRYVSKNNGNVARIEYLLEAFPEGEIIVPLRDPAEHVASLLRQHENFLKQHAADPFIKRYMRDIGHMEFGELHTPFLFPSFEPTEGSPLELDYWLDYWIAAYENVIQQAGKVHFVTLEKLGEQAADVMSALCERTSLTQGEVDLAKHFKPIKQRISSDKFDTKKLAKARELYTALREHEL